MKHLRRASLALLPAAALALTAGLVRGSSHSEAPAIADDPICDNTDVWAWQDSATTMCVIAAYYPFGMPSGGPNYRRFASSDQAIYEIHINTSGTADGVEDIDYQFAFSNVQQPNPNTFLKVTSPAGGYGQLTSPSDPKQVFRQTCTVTRFDGRGRNGGTPSATSTQVTNALVAPPNTGPKLTIGNGTVQTTGIAPNPPTGGYETTLGAAAVTTATLEGGKVFLGPRMDAFFIDLGETFDQLNIRPLNVGASPPNVGNHGGGFNSCSGFNVQVIALQIPIAKLNTAATTVGVWCSASRKKVRVIQPNGAPEVDSGNYVQVSRLGNPLVNELFIPYDQKDKWNASSPQNDVASYQQFFLNPEPTKLINTLYGTAVKQAPTTGRTDLAGLFAPDTLKVRTNLATPLKPTDAGFVGNAQGLLLGRTLADDVVDIYLQAAAGVLIPGGAFNVFPNNALGDGVDFAGSVAQARTTLTFPYIGVPYDGSEARLNLTGTPDALVLQQSPAH